MRETERPAVRPTRRRPTIKDIARAAGVSAGAVSFALNDRPGVSDATRERVKGVARELGWTPSVAALALSANRARAVGLVIARPSDTIADERFFLRLIAGIERVLTARSLSLVLQMVDTAEAEQQAYRMWWSERRVDGVILTDVRDDDPRPALLAELGLPGAVVGGRAGDDTGLCTVQIDDAATTRVIVEHLRDVGRTRLARIGGLADLRHTRARTASFGQCVSDFGLTLADSVATDFTEDAGQRATLAVLDRPERPDAIVYDNEILALGGLAAMHRIGLRVPDDIAVVSWEDSPVCRVVTPQLTALRRDPASLGSAATELLLETIDDHVVRHRVLDLPTLQVRGSTQPDVDG